MPPSRILLTTFGSLGDLHPCLALAVELQRRGHQPTVATAAIYRERVEAAGIAFAPVRLSATEQPTPELIRRILHSPRGLEYLLRELLMPALRSAYEDTDRAAIGADLVISHPVTFAAMLVAAKRGLPWVSTQLAPAGFFSAYDPPMLPGLSLLRTLGLPRAAYRLLFRVVGRVMRGWLRPYDALRRELGLPDTGNPMREGAHAPRLVLALFSRLLGAPQPDWPAQTVVTGFPFYDPPSPPQPELKAWLAAGPPPLLFTLGSSAVVAPGSFFAESAAAARRLGRRALLLGFAGADTLRQAFQTAGAEASRGETWDDGRLFAVPYASYAETFPHAAAVIHQGGAGTTAQALRAGVPMLVVPFGVDQPDNAARVARLGVGSVLRRRQYRAARVAKELARLTASDAIKARAVEVARLVREEGGAARACDAVEAVLPR